MENNFNEIPETPGKRTKLELAEKGGIKNKFIKIRNYLITHWNFRFNTIMGEVEYTEKEKNQWRMLDDRGSYEIAASIVLDENIYCSKEIFRMALYSRDISPDYNPFTSYVFGLPKWDGERDFIAEFLHKQVELKDAAEFPDFVENFKKWFVAMVGSMVSDRTINHVCLVLTGKQSRFKTTFLNSIVPEHLRLDYLYSAKFVPANKDHEIYLATKMLINLDEFASFNRTDIESMKSVITQDRVILRRPYGRMDDRMWRHASFCGSINKNEFLTDFTGSRRFLTVEIENITISKEVDHDRMYSQAYALFKNGYRYWFDQEDVKRIEEKNERFQLVSMEEELIMKHFRVPSEDDMRYQHTFVYMTTTDIAMYLSNLYNKINVNDTYKNRIGLAMNKLGFAKQRKRLNSGQVGRVWIMVKNEEPNKYMQHEATAF